MVRYVTRTTKEVVWYPGTAIVKYREEAVYEYQKYFKVIKIQRYFNKERSVFKTWIQDNKRTLKKAHDHDIRYWKCEKFMKDKGDIDNLVQLTRQHFDLLHALHIWMISSSAGYPAIDLWTIQQFSKRANFYG